MVVCATQKAMRNLHLERDGISAPPLEDTQYWYVNLLRILRVKYDLLTESASLVTVLFPAKGLTSALRFVAAASEVIRRYFARRGWERLIAKSFDIDTTDVVIRRRVDKRVLGSMNDSVSDLVGVFLAGTGERNEGSLRKPDSVVQSNESRTVQWCLQCEAPTLSRGFHVQAEDFKAVS